MDVQPIVDNPRIDELLQEDRVDEAMREPLRSVPSGDKLRALLSSNGAIEDVGYGSLTLGDMLYDYSHIDPNVLAAAEFSHSSSIDSIFSFSTWADKFDNLQSAAGQGAATSLRGYTAERLFAINLGNQGHDVQFPDASNEPGYDALVDGQPFQFKCLENMRGLREHFAQYDYPVIVNSELADNVAGMHGVYVDGLVSCAHVQAVTESSMQHGAGLAGGHVPWISILASSPIPLYRLYRRETDLAGAITAIVTNSGARIAGGSIGGKSAALAGAVLFGPAGAVVGLTFGSIVGASAGRYVAGIARSALTLGDAGAVRDVATETASIAIESLPMKREAWSQKRSALIGATNHNTRSVKIGAYVVARHDDDVAYQENQAHLLDRVRTEMNSLEPLDAWERILTLTKRAGIHAHVIQEPLLRLESLVGEYRKSKARWK
jgi:hypothetical protein